MSAALAARENPGFDRSTQGKIAAFTLARLLLFTAVLFSTIFLRQEVLGTGVVLKIYAVLGASFLFSLINVSFWDQTLRVRLYIPSQLLYDLLLSSYLVYLTGVSDSIFLFLYLLNIVFASVVYQLHGALLVAAVSGAVYAFIYWANIDMEGSSALYNLAYSELLFLLSALLSGQLLDEVKRQKLALEAQRQSIERLELLNDRLLNSIPAGIVTLDSAGYVQNVNRSALELLRMEHPPGIRLKYHELLPALNGILEAWGKMTDTQRIRFSFRHGRGSGEFSLNLVQLRDQGGQDSRGPSHILVFEEVSKLRELERKLELESRLAATGQLAAGIAHEIRNPLASISGAIEMLQAHLQIPDESDRRLFEIATREIRRLNHLITDFLEFAKPKNDDPQDFPLAPAVAEVAEAVQSAAREEAVPQFRFEIPESVAVHANRERVKQVLFNLFLNSVEAAGQAAVEIRVQAGPSEGAAVQLDLLDNGPGVPPELSNRIFDPFFTTKPSGTGLGLATVARILRAAKGDIQLLRSERGAHFRIHLPAAVRAELAGTGS